MLILFNHWFFLPMPYKVFSYKVVIWIVTQCVFWKIECDNPNNVAAWMRFLDGSNFEKILRKTWTRGTWPEAIIHHTDRDWQAKIILWKGLASFHPNVINVFFFHFCMFFLNSGANTVDRGHVRRASWDPYTIGHLWRGGSCEGPNAVRFFALRYGGLQGGLVKIKLQSCNRWICGW